MECWSAFFGFVFKCSGSYCALKFALRVEIDLSEVNIYFAEGGPLGLWEQKPESALLVIWNRLYNIKREK